MSLLVLFLKLKGLQTVCPLLLLLLRPRSALKLASKRWAHPRSNNRSWLDDVTISQSAPCRTSTRADASPLYQRAPQQAVSLQPSEASRVLAHHATFTCTLERTAGLLLSTPVLSSWFSRAISYRCGLLVQCLPLYVLPSGWLLYFPNWTLFPHIFVCVTDWDNQGRHFVLISGGGTSGFWLGVWYLGHRREDPQYWVKENKRRYFNTI